MTNSAPAISEYINLDRGVAYAEYQRHISSYIFASKFVQNKVVLDIACGSGTGSTYLAGKAAGIADRDYEVIVTRDNSVKTPNSIIAAAKVEH